MKNKKLNLIAIALLIFGIANGFAQETISSSGGNATGNGGSASYTAGQMFTAVSGTTGSFISGVQQAYEIFIVGIDETKLKISLSVFPNPTVDNLALQITGYANEKLTYQLFDLQGKLLQNDRIAKSITQINMRNLPSATYFLHILNENESVQTFKIIKNM